MHLLVRDTIRISAIVNELTGPSDGAVVTFEGIVRNQARGKQVRYLEYESYESMALIQMEGIVKSALGKWPIHRMALIHRLGRLEIGDCSVLIAVTSEHRQAAFDACRYAIDTLKEQVPIWKREYYSDGAVWIEGAV